MPDLVGKRYASEIKDNDLYASFRIVMTEENSSDVAAGIVIRQDPAAGSLAAGDGQVLQIVVSKGPNLVEMPDIIGFTQANASKQLDERGIQYKMQIVENDARWPKAASPRPTCWPAPALTRARPSSASLSPASATILWWRRPPAARRRAQQSLPKTPPAGRKRRLTPPRHTKRPAPRQGSGVLCFLGGGHAFSGGSRRSISSRRFFSGSSAAGSTLKVRTPSRR